MNALNIAFAVYLPILLGGFVAIITCLLAGRRSWSRWLCTISLVVTGLLLLLLICLFLQGAASTGWYHGDAGMAGGILLMALIPIAVELVGLLGVAWRLQRLPRDSEAAENGARPDEPSGVANGEVRR